MPKKPRTDKKNSSNATKAPADPRSNSMSDQQEPGSSETAQPQWSNDSSSSLAQYSSGVISPASAVPQWAPGPVPPPVLDTTDGGLHSFNGNGESSEQEPKPPGTPVQQRGDLHHQETSRSTEEVESHTTAHSDPVVPSATPSLNTSETSTPKKVATPKRAAALTEEEIQRRVNEQLEKRVQEAMAARVAEQEAKKKAEEQRQLQHAEELRVADERAKEEARLQAIREEEEQIASVKQKEEEDRRIEALVQQRLIDQQRQAEEQEIQRQKDEQEARRVEAAAAKLREEEENQRREAEAQKKKEEDEKAAALQAMIDKRVQEELQKRLGTTPPPAATAGGASSPGRESSSQAAATNEDCSDFDDEEGMDATTGASFVGDPFDSTLDHGIFSSCSDGDEVERQQLSRILEGEVPFLGFESRFEEEKENSTGKCVTTGCHPSFTVSEYSSTREREEGRCLQPSLQEEHHRPSDCHQAMMLGHFTSKQTVITAVNTLPGRLAIVPRERKSEDRMSVSDATFVFEKDSADLPADEMTDGSLDRHVTADEMVADPSKASQDLYDRLSYPDPIQYWEHTKGNPPPFTVGGGTLTKVWTYDYEPRKMSPLQSQYNAGTLLEVQVKRVAPSLQSLLGGNCDPLFMSMAVYTFGGTTVGKCSETFYTDYWTEQFYPGRKLHPANRLQSFTTFIPTDTRNQPLYLIVRLYRLASADYNDYTDLYVRTAKYNSKHVSDYKQRMMLTASHSEFTQEFAWTAIPLNAGGKLTQGDLVAEKLWLSKKTLSDQSMTEFLQLPEAKKLKQQHILCNVVVSLADVSKHEVSFPKHGADTSSVEEESVITLLNTEQMRAQRRTSRHCPYRLMTLGGAFFNSYANVMYLRLHNFNLGKTNNADLNSKTLTIAVQVALKEHDDTPAEIGLPAVYSRSLADSIVLHSGWSNVTVGTKDCEFHDEFKIQLPLNLTERHHLFFTFWGIPLKKGDKWVKIGHSFLPIFAGSTLLVKEHIPLPVVTPEGMQQVPTGYLVRSAQLNPGMLLQGGNPCFQLSTLCRSSVYSTNPVTSSFHSRMPMAIREIAKDQAVFAVSGTAGHLSSPMDQAHQSLIGNFHEIPFSEQLGQYPMFANFLLSFVASKSTTVGITPRANALKVLLDTTNKIHSWESNAFKKPRSTAEPGKLIIIRTSPMVWLYLFYTNKLLYTDEEFPVYAALPEVICLELKRSSASKTLLALADLIWFTLDLTLRSLYLFMDPNRKDREGKKLPPHVIDPTFYKVLESFVMTIISKLVHQGGQSLASRLTVFLRQLMRVCDRGAVLSIAETMLKQLVAIGLTPNVHSSMRIFMEADQAVLWSLPSPLVRRPQFFARMAFNVLVPHLMLKARDHRVNASTMLYQFLHAATHNPNHGGTDLTGLGNAAFELTEVISANWGIFKAHDGKGAETQTSVNDKRQLLVIAMWGLTRQSPVLFKQWIREVAGKPPKKNPLAGLLFMLDDAVSTFRYTAGRDKKDLRLLRKEEKNVKLPGPEERAQADARFSTFVCLLVSRVANLVLDEAHALLATVKEETPHPVCSLFLNLMQNICNTNNSFTSLEAGVLLLYKTHIQLFPEFISKKAKHSPGLVLIAIKLMSVGAKSVRALATKTYMSIAQKHYEILGSLSKLKHYTASALVQVSEQNNQRNMTRAGDYIQSALQKLCKDATGDFPRSDELYLKRYINPDHDIHRSQSASSLTQPNHGAECTIAILSFDPFVDANKLDSYRQVASSHLEGQNFSDQFGEMCKDMGTLLTDVVQMQADDSMKLQEVKTSAYRQICATFLRQNSLAESLKWFSKLRDSHAQHKDFVEAGLTCVYMAAIGFRVASLYYSMNGHDATGCKIPPAFFTHVYWHHFTRLLPELEDDLSVERMQSMVRDMSCMPEDRCFSLEGQSQLMHEAATSFAKASHWELSFVAIRAVDAVAEGMNDFEALLQVHDAMKTWAHAMNEGKKTGNWRKRVSAKYYYLRAEGGGIHTSHLEEAGGQPVAGGNTNQFQRIYRMNQVTTLETFQNFTRGVLSAAVADQGHIFFDDGFGNLSGYDGKALQGTAKQRAALVEGRCVACCYEVQPVVEEEYLDVSVPMSLLHQTCYHKRFHHFSRVHADSKLSIPENPKLPHSPARGGQTAPPAATPQITKDVTKHIMQTQEHVIAVGFPSIVSCQSVVSTVKKSMDCYQTAVMTIQDRLWKLQETTPETYVNILVNTMTPLGYQPPGAYYKAVLENLGSNEEVLNVATQYIKLAKSKLIAIEKQLMAKQPENYAKLIKGIVDMECTLQMVQAAHQEQKLQQQQQQQEQSD